LSWWGVFIFRKNLFPKKLLWCFAAFTFSGWVATLAGWLVTEIGRQPWLVTGILLTADAAGDVSGAKIGASHTAYVLIYSALLISYMGALRPLAGKGAES